MMQTLTPNPEEFDIAPITKPKKKRKSAGKVKAATKKKSRLDDEWQEANVDTEEMMKSVTVDGFMGLEELTDYTEDDLKAMLGVDDDADNGKVTETDNAATSVDKPNAKPKKKKKKKKLTDNTENICIVRKTEDMRVVDAKDAFEEQDRTTEVAKSNSSDTDTNANKETNADLPKSSEVPAEPISKGQKKKLALKEKQRKKKLLKLKEKLKKRKELLKENGEVVNNKQKDNHKDNAKKAKVADEEDMLSKLDEALSNKKVTNQEQPKEKLTKRKKKKLKRMKETENAKQANELGTKTATDGLDNSQSNSSENEPATTIEENDDTIDDKQDPNAEPTEAIESAATCPALVRDVDGKDMSEWSGLDVPNAVLKALAEKDFLVPTPIQKESLPSAIAHRRDVIGAAETGSGKTLAFGIPLIKLIMDAKARLALKKPNLSRDDLPLYALVLTPTRELALQVQQHISHAAKYSGLTCIAVVGGMAPQKQERLLGKFPEIVVGTPGRLNKLMGDGELHLSKLPTLRYLVIDECDRMLEFGHFKDLEKIIEMVNRASLKKQVFLYSATLTLPTVHSRKKAGPAPSADDQLDRLVDQVGVSAKAKVIDLSSKHVTAKKLKQEKITCNSDRKDDYLLYFLLTHPGRTIVFANSVSCTKKLCSLFTLLGREPLQLHAGKQQRQRLKMLDRFIARDNALLISTDVAARGLDIPKVQYVVHYQLPLDPKIYVHRSGRTARAHADGQTLILEAPEDHRHYKKINFTLKLDDEVKLAYIDESFMEGIKKRVLLAKQVEQTEYKLRKQAADANWQKRAAESMDIQLSDDDQPDADGADGTGMTKKEKKQLNRMKKDLDQLLKETIYQRGFSGSYPTQSGQMQLPGLKLVQA